MGLDAADSQRVMAREDAVLDEFTVSTTYGNA